MNDDISIHPLALVEPGAKLGRGVKVGPFCHVGQEVVLGDGVELVSHVVVSGATTLGAGCKVYPMAVLGAPPQNAKHKGGRTTLTIGSNCTIREGVTMHLGSDSSRGATTVGNNCNFLAYSHVAHDCAVGNNVTMANLATLGGHCEVGDFVNLGGLAAVHQMTRIGHHAFIGGTAGVAADVMPYGIVEGNRGTLRGLNVIGMKRSGLSREEIHGMRRAYRMIFDRARPVAENLEVVARELGDMPLVRESVAFFRERGHQPYLVPPLDQSSSDDADGDD